MTFNEREAYALTIIPDAFEQQHLEAAFGMALARQESAFDPHAVATNPKDLAMGGAYGWLQMTMNTAQSLGFQGTKEELLKPETNAAIAALLCASNARRMSHLYVTADYLEPTKFYADLAAMYNSGRRFTMAPRVTRETYVPRVMSFFQHYLTALSPLAVVDPPKPV